MKIVHFSDSHLGVTTHGKMDPKTGINSRVLDFFNSLCQVVDFIEDKKPDIVLFSGDAFHNNSPSPQQINLFGEIVENIAAVCPMVIIPGNHDQTVNERDSAVSVFQPYDNVHCDDFASSYQFRLPGGLLQVDTFPYPRKYNGDVLGQLSKSPIFAGKALADYHVAVGHFSVQGCIYGYEKLLSLSMDAPVTLDMFAGIYNYSALGHIHVRQQLGKRDIWYAGSTDRIDFGEEEEEKGFNAISIDDRGTYVEFIPLNVRPMKTFRYDLTDVKRKHTSVLLAELEKDAEGLDEAIVRMEVLVDDYCLDVPRIHQSTNFHNLVALKEIPQKKSSLVRIEESLFEMNDTDVLDSYFQKQDYDDAEIIELLDLFEEIVTDD